MYKFVTMIRPKKSINDLILLRRTNFIYRKLIKEHENSDLLKSNGIEPSNRILLIGDVGNGKASFAEAIAFELNKMFLSCKFSAIIKDTIEETCNNLRNMFSFFGNENCVLFFDDLQTAFDYQVIYNVLFDCIKKATGNVIIIASTTEFGNSIKRLKDTFQFCLEMPNPTKTQAKEFFNRFKERIGFDPGCTPEQFSGNLHLFSYAELDKFCKLIHREYLLHRENKNGESVGLEKIIDNMMYVLYNN